MAIGASPSATCTTPRRSVRPRRAPRCDLVDPRWKGKIASSYPHDDDAVLYLYSLYAQTYGWDWVAKLAAQDVRFARGSHSPGDAVSGRQKAIGVGGAGSLTAPSPAPVRLAIADGHPFMAWGQRAAILKQAANPTAAKLYLNWQLSTELQILQRLVGAHRHHPARPA